MRQVSLMIALLTVGLSAASAQQGEKKMERRIEIVNGQIKVYVDGKEVSLAEAFAQGGPFGRYEMRIIVNGKEIKVPPFDFSFGGEVAPWVRGFVWGGWLPNRRVDLNANDVPLAEALDRLFKDTGYTVRFEEGVDKDAKVTAVLKNVPFDLALRTLLEQAGVGYRFGGERTILITKSPFPRFGTFPLPRVEWRSVPSMTRLQPFLFGRGRSESVVTLDGRTLRSGVEGEEFFVELEGPAKATVRTLDKDGKVLKTTVLEVKEGKQRTSLKLSDIPRDGSGVVTVEMGRARVDITVEEGG
ncbi:MAG: STN domain-containing protein, partial [Abditibacteriales bacterium]|nr:STN domain-containing protein [Abditibacteriales bacterium]MDW8368115.1 STN domain-containing protein [Abditibacteriales bacterium]